MADRLVALNIGPVVTMLPSATGDCVIRTAQGNKVIVCPAITRDNVTCESCKLCAWTERKVIIGFPSHGASKKRADMVQIGRIQ